MAGNANNEAESQTSGVISVGDVSIVTVPDDIFLHHSRFKLVKEGQNLLTWEQDKISKYRRLT